MQKGDREIKAIIARCQKNERAAQKELYMLFYSFGMGICMRYSDNREDAVEILNDGFLRVFQYIRSFKADKDFNPWFRRILINCAIDHLRKKELKIDQYQQDLAEAVIQFPSVEGHLAYEELLEIMRKLPNAYRTVFNLIAIEGFRHEEVAGLLNISVGTSKSNYHRARQKLQQYLKEYLIER